MEDLKIESKSPFYISPRNTMTDQVDIFQFYSGSADVAPGKGAGETLVSPPATYTSLRKLQNWRRSIAAGEKLDEILPLTGSAQLWEAPLKKPKAHRQDLEKKREELQKPKEVKEEPYQQMEASAPKKTKQQQLQELLEKKRAEKAAASAAAPQAEAKEEEQEQEQEQEQDEIAFAPPELPAQAAEKAKTKRTKKTAAPPPEPVLAQPNAAKVPVEVERPDMKKEEESSTMRFCPIDGYYLFLQVSTTKETRNMAHYRLCRNCGYKEQDEKGGLLSEILVQEKSAEGYKILLNEHTRKDPRLPHLRGVIKCPNAGCASNTSGQESDIIYLKYDSVNLMYLYICDICATEWRSRR
jgi:hypothetical protein